MSRLSDALLGLEKAFSEDIEKLREIATPETENEVYDITFGLREAVTLVGCLRRLTEGRTVAELHHAFGAPGDFGYHTPLGDALYRVYRNESEVAQ